MYARVQIKLGLMTTGIFGTFVYALFKSYEPVKGLGTVYQQFEQAFGVSAKVFEYLGLAEEPAKEPGVPALPPFSQVVEFDHVSFGYDPETPILRDVSLTASAGEVIAIVGSSGAGKTTLVNLLPRLYPVNSGAVRLDGMDVREVTLRSLRDQMAIVTQETILFNDTVWNNIAMGGQAFRKNAWRPQPRRRWRMTLFSSCRRAIRRCSVIADSALVAGSGSASPSRARF